MQNNRKHAKLKFPNKHLVLPEVQCPQVAAHVSDEGQGVRPT